MTTSGNRSLIIISYQTLKYEVDIPRALGVPLILLEYIDCIFLIREGGQFVISC